MIFAGRITGNALRVVVSQDGRSDDVIIDGGNIRTGIRVLAERSEASRRDILAAIRRSA